MIAPQRKNKIYGNFRIFSKEGNLLFIASEKRANWYLSRNLAEIVDSHTIKFNFEAGGVGAQFDKYCLSKKDNICVVCGEDDLSKLERHHIVPREYRKHLPINIKNHNSHDIVVVCNRCHKKYENKFATLKKKNLAKRYKAQLNSGAERKAISFSHQYIFNSKIPEARKLEMRKIINKIFKSIYKRDVKDADILRLSNINIKEYDFQREKHGMIVISKIKNTNLFIKRWRKHFVESMHPQFMPEFWSIYYSKN